MWNAFKRLFGKPKVKKVVERADARPFYPIGSYGSGLSNDEVVNSPLLLYAALNQFNDPAPISDCVCSSNCDCDCSIDSYTGSCDCSDFGSSCDCSSVDCGCSCDCGN